MKKLKNLLYHLSMFCIVGISIIAVMCFFIYITPEDPIGDCAESGMCKEGVPIYINGENVFINKQVCLDNNWKWYSETSSCDIRSKLD